MTEINMLDDYQCQSLYVQDDSEPIPLARWFKSHAPEASNCPLCGEKFGLSILLTSGGLPDELNASDHVTFSFGVVAKGILNSFGTLEGTKKAIQTIEAQDAIILSPSSLGLTCDECSNIWDYHDGTWIDSVYEETLEEQIIKSQER